MKNSSTFLVPALAGAVFVLLGLGCWYMGPNKHAVMLQYENSRTLQVENSHHRVVTSRFNEIKSHKPSLGNCEKCQKPLRTVHGKFGDFVGCSGYPACKYIQRQKASFFCPECRGAIEKRVWSGGILWGCCNYPNCRYAIFSDIEDKPCTKCNASLYLLKTIDVDGKIVLSCPNGKCA